MNLANQVSIPAPAAAAKQSPPIGYRETAPIANRQHPGGVRPQCDRETRDHLVKRPGSLCLSREAGIAFVAVHDGARRAAGGRSKVHEVQPVVVAESHIGHQEGARRRGRLNQEDACTCQPLAVFFDDVTLGQVGTMRQTDEIKSRALDYSS